MFCKYLLGLSTVVAATVLVGCESPAADPAAPDTASQTDTAAQTDTAEQTDTAAASDTAAATDTLAATDAAASQPGATTLGSAGGTAKSDAGNASVSIPAGVLQDGVVITVETVAKPAVEAERASDVVDFGPDGSQFSAPVTICLTVDEGVLAGKNACLGFLDEAKSPAVWTCQDDALTVPAPGFRCGKTDHFTDFAILLSGNNQGSATKASINQAGGTLMAADGSAFVDVPAGALKAELAIVISPVPKPTVAAEFASAVVDLGPSGTMFASPVSVCLKGDAGLIGQKGACLGFFDEASKKWVCQDPCLTQVSPSFWCGQTDHFTNFALLLGGAGDDDECGDKTVIGSLGGIVFAPQGAGWAEIPAGATGTDLAVTAQVVKPAVPTDVASPYVDFGPSISSFAEPVTICLQGDANLIGQKGACLGFFDTANKTWVCEDKCLKQASPSFWCGKTDHFTNFALLLGGAGSDKECGGGDYITSKGGLFNSSDGSVTITVPAGAVQVPTLLTASASNAKVPPSFSKPWDLGPLGQKFSAQVTLCIKPTEVVSTTESLCLATLSTKAGSPEWVCEDSCVTVNKNGQVCGKTDHFSTWAIVKSPNAVCKVP